MDGWYVYPRPPLSGGPPLPVGPSLAGSPSGRTPRSDHRSESSVGLASSDGSLTTILLMNM